MHNTTRGAARPRRMSTDVAQSILQFTAYYSSLAACQLSIRPPRVTAAPYASAHAVGATACGRSYGRVYPRSWVVCNGSRRATATRARSTGKLLHGIAYSSRPVTRRVRPEWGKHCARHFFETESQIGLVTRRDRRRTYSTVALSQGAEACSQSTRLELREIATMLLCAICFARRHTKRV